MTAMDYGEVYGLGFGTLGMVDPNHKIATTINRVGFCFFVVKF
jgi:hypothetical protein